MDDFATTLHNSLTPGELTELTRALADAVIASSRYDRHLAGLASITPDPYNDLYTRANETTGELLSLMCSLPYTTRRQA